MGEPARKRPTYADVLALGDDVHAEIIDGVLVVHASPAPDHGSAQAGLACDIVGAFQRGRGGPGGWWIMSEVDVQLPDGQVYRPDLLGLRRDRVPEFPHGRPLTIRPDWVCEVLSPSNSWYDWGPKREGWHRFGVPHLWLLDPMARTLTVLVRADEAYLVAAVAYEGTPARLAPFDAIELRLEEILAPPPPGERRSGEDSDPPRTPGPAAGEDSDPPRP